MNEVEKDLLNRMGYRDGLEKCENCQHFLCYDDRNYDRCGLNPALDIPISRSGHCKYYLQNAPAK